jgi:ABC-type transport system involved in multi-copper enzyme maturation permease subunit
MSSAKLHIEPKGAIRDQGWKRYEGAYTSPSNRWKLIAGRMLRMSVRQGWVITMIILCVFPALVMAVLLFLQSKLWSAGVGGPPDHYAYYLYGKPYGTLLIAFLTALFAGGGAVADDVRTGAFQLYFARPLTREQYLAGKLIPPVLLVLFVSSAPGLVLSILRIAVAKDGADGAHAAYLLLKATGLGAIEALALGIPVVALSSMAKSRGLAQGLYAALFMLPWMLGSLFADVTRSAWPQLFSLPHHLQVLGRALFEIAPEATERLLPVWVSSAMLAILIAGSVAVLRKRLASVEVIAS